MVAASSTAAAQTSPIAPRTEQEWVVRSIIERIWRIAAVQPVDGGAPAVLVTTLAASPAAFAVTVGSAAPVKVPVTGHLWDARSYVELARLALGARTAAVPSRTDDGEGVRLLEALLAPSLALLLDEDRRLSVEIRKPAPAAAAHERAALLLAVMACRDGAGVFTDERPALSRMTAHLAVAAALRGAAGPGPAGATADAVLLALVGRERDAVAAAEALSVESSPSPQRAWARVVQLRATGNWRRLPWPGRATPLERLEYGRALATRLGDPRLVSWLDEVREPAALSWTRIALADGFSVETGHRFVMAGFALEIEELARARREHRGPGAAPDAIATLLVTPARPADALRVLDWPLWANAAERHLAARAVDLHRYHRDLLGQRQRATEVLKEIDESLAGLRLLAPVQALLHDDTTVRSAALDASAALVRADPHLLPPAAWHVLAARHAGAAARLPLADAWFSPWMPDGTLLRPIERSMQPRKEPQPPTPTLERYHAMAPSEAWVSWTLAWRHAIGAPPVAEARRRLAPLLDYDARPLRWMMRDLSPAPAEAIALATSMCELDVDHCVRLATLHLIDGDDVEAAAEYERWFWRASDRVRASNNVRWLVGYLYDAGQVDRAVKIAEAAAAVGSAAGLEVHGELLERQDRLADAEAIFARIAERYDSPRFLGVYYLRRGRSGGGSLDRTRGVGLLKERLPYGLEPAVTDGPSPTDGVTVEPFGWRAAGAGLQKGDVIVGMHGYRVRTWWQIWTFSRLTFDDAVSFVVWRDGRYQTVTGRLGQQTLGGAPTNYKAPASTR